MKNSKVASVLLIFFGLCLLFFSHPLDWWKKSKLLGLPNKAFKVIDIRFNGKSLNPQTGKYLHYLEKIRATNISQNQLQEFKNTKKKYLLELEVIQKESSKPGDEFLNDDKLVIQASLFDESTKNKLAEKSFDCCD